MLISIEVKVGFSQRDAPNGAEFGVDIPVLTFYEEPTVSGLASFIAAQMSLAALPAGGR